MTKIASIAAPKDADKKYQFFKDETGQMWKATVDTQVARPAMLAQADVEAAPAELALTVTVSPTDAAGKALRNEEDQPIIIDTLTHTFTSFEMAEEGFDVNKRIGRIVAERVELGQARLSGHDKLKNFVEEWNSNKKVNIVFDTADDTDIKVTPTPGVADNGNK